MLYPYIKFIERNWKNEAMVVPCSEFLRLSMPTISKTKYIDGLQCHKLLWYHYNNNEAFPQPDQATLATLRQGQLVGEYAKKLFPDGIEVAKGIVDFNTTLSASREAAGFRRPLFEAAFQYRGAYARSDILVPAPESTWDLIEVKSTTSVKKHHHHDIALQKHVCDGAGISIRRCFLMHLNNGYVRQGEIEARKLFRKEDVTEQVSTLVNEIAPTLGTMAAVIRQPSAPAIMIGPHCNTPRGCPLIHVCWRFLPRNNVTELYRGRKKPFELISKGILSLADIPDDISLTDSQRIQVSAVRSGQPHSNREAIKNFLESLTYPLYFLDFETFSTAIPLIDNARPHQQIPFQFSLHILDSLDADPVHHSYLADGPMDARPEILNRLKDLLHSHGTILTFNASFEKRVLSEMSRDYPEYKEWFELTKPRIADLIIPFRSFAYYHPDQEGTASIKSVLPVLTGKSYSGLTIADGGTASLEFLRVTFGEVDPSERERVRTDLETYCGLDTEGMIDILRSLHSISRTHNTIF